MLDGMRTVGVPSCLFFFAVHLIGNFLMLNLFALGTSRIVSVIRTVAAQGALYSPSKERGIFKSTDGGETWTGLTRAPGFPEGPIGKIGITDAILLKPGKLTDEEWVVMRRHPAIGFEILKAIPGLEFVELENATHCCGSAQHQRPA
jgi:hypothetical protein